MVLWNVHFFWCCFCCSVLGAQQWIGARLVQIASDKSGYRTVASGHNCEMKKRAQPLEPRATTMHRSSKWLPLHQQQTKMMNSGAVRTVTMLTVETEAKHQAMWRKQLLHTSTTKIRQSIATPALLWAFCYQLLWLPALSCGCSMHIVIHTQKAVNFWYRWVAQHTHASRHMQKKLTILVVLIATLLILFVSILSWCQTNYNVNCVVFFFCIEHSII